MGNEKTTPLIEAIKKNDIEEVRRLIEAGADVNEAENVKYDDSDYDDFDDSVEDGKTPLMYAVENNSEEIVEFLIAHNADVNTERRMDFHYGKQLPGESYDCIIRTPLFIAVDNRNIEIVKLLLKNGADASYQKGSDILSDYHESILMAAAFYNSKEIAKLLIENGADINARENISNRCVLNYTAESDAKETAEFLISCEGNDYDKEDYEILLSASVRAGSEKMVKFLIEFGIDFKSVKSFGRTLLMEAVYRNHKNIAQFLIDNGADVNAVCDDHCEKWDNGKTALIFAAEKDSKEVASILINNGADIRANDANGISVLSYAAFYNAKNVADILIAHCADVNVVDDEGGTPLMYAARKNSIDVAKLLIEHGADINAQTKERKSVLNIASENKSNDVVELLLEKGANPITDGKCDVNAISIEIPEGISLANDAFTGCSKLQSITIPYGIDVFNDETFENGTEEWEVIDFSECTALKEVFYKGTKAQWNFETGFALTGLAEMGVVVHCSDGDAENIYEKDDIVIPDGIERVADFLFFNHSLGSITIPKSVTYIGTTFKHCDIGTMKLMGTKLPETASDYTTFRDCSIDCIEYTGTKEEWSKGFWAFFNYDEDIDYNRIPYPQPLVKCSDGEIHMEKGELLLEIEDSVLKKCLACVSGNEIEIPDTVKEIGERAFLLCCILEEITIPLNVTKIGEEAFDLVNTSINYAGTMAQWEKIEKPENWFRCYYQNETEKYVCCLDGKIKLTIPMPEQKE